MPTHCSLITAIDKDVDQKLRQAEQEAVRSGNWQRVFNHLLRMGEDDAAMAVAKKGPISVDCRVEYLYQIQYTDTDSNRDWIEEPTLEEAIEEFASLNVAASLITYIVHQPFYTILGKQFIGGLPFQGRRFEIEEIYNFKERVRNHPDYMRTATSGQRAEAQTWDSLEIERMVRQIRQAQEQREARERKEQAELEYRRACKQWRAEVWELWKQHQGLERREVRLEQFFRRFERGRILVISPSI